MQILNNVQHPDLELFNYPHQESSLVAQMVKRLPTMQEIQVQFLGWEESLEKEIATHSSTLAWKIPWKEEPGRQQRVHGVTKSQDTTEELSNFTFFPSLGITIIIENNRKEKKKKIAEEVNYFKVQFTLQSGQTQWSTEETMLKTLPKQ